MAPSTREHHPLPAVGAIILDDDSILLIRRGHAPHADQWSVPGGRVEWGETLENALKREVQEEGPLDLLLYLIRRQEIDIYDIPVAKITEQFLDYLALMEAMDIEVAADFLVMAATLMEIKSRLLLPKPPVQETEEDEEEADPRAELVRRLLEYQSYKAAAGEFQRLAGEQQRLFARTTIVPNLPFSRPDPNLAGSPDAFSLWTALQEVLARIEAAGPVVREVARRKLTIRQQMLHILNMLDSSPGGVTFSAVFFFPGREDLPTRSEVIVTFLALLELMRLHRIAVEQPDLFGEIKLVAVSAQMAL